MGNYNLQLDEIRNFYQKKHRNWVTMEAKKSRWSMRNSCQVESEKTMHNVQGYLANMGKSMTVIVLGWSVVWTFTGVHCVIDEIWWL